MIPTSNMTDVEARREARRRKILENSEKRLMKITGVEKKTTKAEVDGVVSSSNDRLESRDYQHNHFNGLRIHSNEEVSTEVTNNGEFVTSPNPSFNHNSVSTAEPLNQENSRHIYIISMSLILSLLLVICDIFQIDLGHWYINKIFVPLIAFEVFDICFGSLVNTAPTFVSFLILLTSNRVIGLYSKYIQTFVQHILKIVQDVMIFFFVFIVGDSFMRMCLRI